MDYRKLNNEEIQQLLLALSGEEVVSEINANVLKANYQWMTVELTYLQVRQ